MAEQTRTTLKGYFNTGDVPTEAQFADFIDSAAQPAELRSVTVSTAVTGALTVADHSGKMLVTSGNVTVPHASGSKGFNAVLIAGGAHTVTFNSTVSAAMAAGDMMTVFVQDDADGTPTIRATLVAAADQVSFT